MSEDEKPILRADGKSDKPRAIKIKDPDSQNPDAPRTPAPAGPPEPEAPPSDFIRPIHNDK